MFSSRSLTRRRCAASVLAAFAFAPLAVIAADVTMAVPEDAYVAVWADDAKSLKEAFKASALGRAWQDPQLEPLREFVDGKLEEMKNELSENTTVTPEEIVSAFSGGFTFFVGPTEDSVYGILLAETDESGQATFKKLTESIQEDTTSELKKSSFETAGTTVYVLEQVATEGMDDSMDAEEMPAKKVHYAVAGNTFVFGLDASDDHVKQALNALSGEGSGGLKSRDTYRQVSGKLNNASERFSVYVNVEKALTDSIQKGGGGENMDQLRQTGLMDFKGLVFSALANAGEVTSNAYLTVAPQKNGLVKAFYDMDNISMSTAKMVPADAYSFTAYSLDVKKLVEAALEIGETFQPGISGMVGMQIAMMQQQVGVDPLEGIVKNLAGEHLFYERELDRELKSQLPEEEAALATSQVYLFGLRNGDQVVGNLNTAITKLKEDPQFGGLLETSDIDGMTLVTIKMPGAEQSPIQYSFAYNQNHVIVANNRSGMQEAVRYALGKGTASIADSPEYQKLAGMVDKSNLRMFAYSNQKAAAEQLGAVRTMLMQMPEEDLGFPPEVIPPAEVFEKYFGSSVSATRLGDTLIEFHSTMPAK